MSSSPGRLDPAALESLVETADLSQVEVGQLIEWVRRDPRLRGRFPAGDFAIDPRNGDRILFAPGRMQRPNTLRDDPLPAAPAKPCPICAGDTTGVIDVAPLSDGHTLINKNLFPMVNPSSSAAARGLHLLQWTSSVHDRDWHNLPLPDCVQVMRRLAALEAKMTGAAAYAPQPAQLAHVSIIKNAGAEVGASIEHGHQQICVSNLPPRRVLDHQQFEHQHGHTLSQHVLATTDAELTIREYETAKLLVPPFMKRPYDLLLLLKDTSKQYLHQLDEAELADFTRGWHEALSLFHLLIPQLGKPVAYNVLVHNGAGLYAEFLPHTQVRGGFEQSGLYVCQASPPAAAARLKELLDQ